MSSNEYINEMYIDEPLLNSAVATFSWGKGNQMVVGAGNVTGENTDEAIAGPVVLHALQWNKDMHWGIARKLLNESYQVFMEVQTSRKELSGTATMQPLLLKLSRKYRSILQSCVLELKTGIEGSTFFDDESVVEQMKLFKMMETLWHLFEILFIENPPAGVVLSRLCGWCNWHFTYHEDMVEECIQSEQPHLHDLYWHTIKYLVYQGRTDDAQNVLKLHPSAQRGEENAFTSLAELLRKMPKLSLCHSQSVVEFDLKWNHWREECLRRSTEGEFDMDENLLEISAILCGEESAFENPESGSWYQMLVSKLLYTQPTVGIAELNHHSKLAAQVLRDDEKFGAFDDILLAAFELDPYLLLKECSQQLSNWWLPAHLADLFHHSGLLSQKKLEFGVDFREHLLLEYATSLMSHDGIWKVAVGYFSACSENGSNYLSLFVQRVPLTSEKRVAKLLRVCQNHGLATEISSICRQMSVSALRHNRIGTALVWCIRAGDSSLAMHIADKMLKEYARTGEFQYMDVLDYLGSAVILSDQLAFLGKYRDFHKVLGQGQLSEAGNILLHLITSKLAPKEFWPSLLSDLLIQLDHEQVIYSASESVKLLANLNSVDFTKLNASQTETEKEKLEKKLELLRLSLSRNLARAIVTTP